MSVDRASANASDPPAVGGSVPAPPDILPDIKSKLNMPNSCQCGFYEMEEGDTKTFLWHYLTQCPIGPKDHKAVWRPAFKEIIDSCMGLAQIEGGANIVIDEGDMIPRRRSWPWQTVEERDENGNVVTREVRRTSKRR